MYLALAHHHLNEIHAQNQSEVKKFVERGKYYLKHKRGKDPRNLLRASGYFMKARSILSRSHSPDPAAIVEILHEITNVQMEMSYHQGIDPQAKQTHLQIARRFSDNTLEYANRSSRLEQSTLVRLYQAILSGREAEVSAKIGTAASIVRRQMDEAVNGIKSSMVELEGYEDAQMEKHRAWAESWLTRLERT